MGTLRNGARTALNLLHKVCKLSHLPGFRSGLNSILGVDDTDSFYIAWTPLCNFIELLVANDNFYNQIDYVEEEAGSEDIGGV